MKYEQMHPNHIGTLLQEKLHKAMVWTLDCKDCDATAGHHCKTPGLRTTKPHGYRQRHFADAMLLSKRKISYDISEAAVNMVDCPKCGQSKNRPCETAQQQKAKTHVARRIALLRLLDKIIEEKKRPRSSIGRAAAS